MSLAVDAPAVPASGRPDFDVAVIGAGFSGIGMGVALSRAGIERFVVLEEGDGAEDVDAGAFEAQGQAARAAEQVDGGGSAVAVAGESVEARRVQNVRCRRVYGGPERARAVVGNHRATIGVGTPCQAACHGLGHAGKLSVASDTRPARRRRRYRGCRPGPCGWRPADGPPVVALTGRLTVPWAERPRLLGRRSIPGPFGTGVRPVGGRR